MDGNGTLQARQLKMQRMAALFHLFSGQTGDISTRRDGAGHYAESSGICVKQDAC